MHEGGREGYAQLLGVARARAGHKWFPFAPEKRYGLLAYLACSGDWVSRERVAYLFWPDTSTERAQQNLRQLLHRVCSFEWLSGLEVEAQRLRWKVETDVAAFKRALEQDNLGEALFLYSGPLLENLETDEAPEFSSWLEIEREHLHSLWHDALLKRIQQLQEQEKYGEAAKLLHVLVKKDPFDEEALAAYLDPPALPVSGRSRSTMRVHMLGELRFELDERSAALEGSPRLQMLLAYLLLRRGAPQPRSQLAYTLWPDSSDAQARTNLRQLLHHLKRALPEVEGVLELSSHTLAWRAEAPSISDVEAFESAVTAGERAERVEKPAEALAHYERAVSHYRGDLLPGFYEDWIEAERERLKRRFSLTLECLVALSQACGERRKAVLHAERLLGHDPLEEANYRRLMRLYAEAGERAKALYVYHRCASVLEQELALTPGEETEDLYQALLRLDEQEASAPLAAPLLGRLDELTLLHRLWRQAAESGPRIALISGESGVGKTRLAEALATQLQRGGAMVVAARCYPAEGRLAYAPVTTLFRTEPLRRSLAGLAGVWRSAIARLLPELLDDPGLISPGPLSEDWQRQRLFEALKRAVLARQPVLLWLDDLQWCDQDTLEWLHYLSRSDPEAKLMLLTSARTEDVTPEHPLGCLLSTWRGEGLLAELELSRLNKDETRALASRLAGAEFDEETAVRLYAESEGNPLFVVEMVRGGGAAGSLRLPPKIQAVIAHRFLTLSPAARELLEVAAVIGRTFSLELLTQVSRYEETLLVSAIDELWRRRIVREEESGAYDFSHAKLREVAYTGLSLARRRLLHRYVAEALETHHADDVAQLAGQLAVHHECSGALEHAAPYCFMAAEAAKDFYANEQAAGWYSHGLGLVERLPKSESLAGWRMKMSAQLHEGLADLFWLSRKHDSSREHYHAALEWVPEQDGVWRARLWRKLGKTRSESHYDEALALYRTAEEALGEPTDASWQQEWIELQLARASAHYWSGEERKLEAVIVAMEPAVRRYGTARQKGAYFHSRCTCGMRQERFVTSRQILDDASVALSAVQETGDINAIADIRFGLGFYLLWRGDFSEAESQIDSALALARQVGKVSLTVRCLTYLCVIFRQRRERRKLLALVSTCLKSATEAQMPVYIAAARANLAWLAWLEGDWPNVREEAQAALQHWQTNPSYPFKWLALFPLMAAELRQGQLGAALEHARSLLDPKQQRLPEAITAELERALTATRPMTSKEHLIKVLRLAEAERLS